MTFKEAFDKLFNRPPKNRTFAPTMNGYAPIYSQYGTEIYFSDVVQQALKCIVDEIKKLTPTHVRYVRNDPTPIRLSTIQKVLNEPNELMTSVDFLEKVTWLLLMNYNAFVIPVYRVWTDESTGEERRYYEALYPIRPTQVDFIQDDSGTLFVRFFFPNGYNTTLRYADVIHIKTNYAINEYMGGNELGQPDHAPLLDTLNLNRELLAGIARAMKASYAVNGIVKYNTLLDDGAMDKALADITQRLIHNESGFLPIDLKAEFIPLERKSEIVNGDLVRFIDEKILRNWGISSAILSGDYTKEQYEAFYQKALEPIILSFSQAFTKTLFTPREKSFGNKIEFYPEQLIFMSISQKIEMINLLSPTGALFENEKRTILGLMPLPELEGKRFMSLNWIDANDASQYQVGKVNVDVVDEEKTVTGA